VVVVHPLPQQVEEERERKRDGAEWTAPRRM
jgi:hypothetical protein